MKPRLIFLAFWAVFSVVAQEPTNLVEILRNYQSQLDQIEPRGQASAKPQKKRRAATAPVAPSAPVNQLTDPSAADSPAPGTAQLAPGDIIEIVVVDDTRLSLPRAAVLPDGSVAHPYLGQLAVGGRTPAEAETSIRELLAKDYLEDPKVAVRVLEPARCSFSIAQHVLKPGVYSWPANETMTVLRALAMAGGATRSASLAHVTVRRVINGELEVLKLDLEELRRNPTSPPFLVRNGDVIEVGGR